MIYIDDEPIRRDRSRETEEDADVDLDGRVEGRIINKVEAPMEETPFRVLLELKGIGGGEGRLGLDLVTVLDISGSMSGKKLGRLKLAMQFLLQKLGPTDRLSVVTFNRNAQRLCPLRQITDDSRIGIENLVNVIQASGSTNTAAGLQLAVDVLDGRTITKRRRTAIMLMSDGDENGDSDAASVPVGKVPIYTFGFGKDYNPEVLSVIAAKSNGGMFSAVPHLDNLGIAFSQCLAGLLNVVTEDLSLTMTPLHSTTFKEVKAGIYPQSTNEDTGSVTVSFGSLYDRETRRILVELLLPAVRNRMSMAIITITYKYRVCGSDTFKTEQRSIHISRKGTSTEPEIEEVMIEEKRLLIVTMMKQARSLAEAYNLEAAQEKLINARQYLSDEVDGMLKSDLDQLILLMESMDTYYEKGRSFALSSEASHDRQRFAARGDVEKLRFFNTPLMDLYLKQALAFDEDPTMPVPTKEEDRKAISVDKPMDVKNETIGINRNFGSLFGSLMKYIYMIVQFVKAIANRMKLWEPVVGNLGVGRE
ncbi:hypothetical protein ACHQM5_025015 [Ranunculus cassubicifolius]